MWGNTPGRLEHHKDRGQREILWRPGRPADKVFGLDLTFSVRFADCELTCNARLPAVCIASLRQHSMVSVSCKGRHGHRAPADSSQDALDRPQPAGRFRPISRRSDKTHQGSRHPASVAPALALGKKPRPIDICRCVHVALRTETTAKRGLRATLCRLPH
jgi:hypothetical protein